MDAHLALLINLKKTGSVWRQSFFMVLWFLLGQPKIGSRHRLEDLWVYI